MTKKEIITPIIVIGLTLLFAGVCIAVFLTKGKSKKWIARKMKIGGLLLSLTALSLSTVTSCCYKPDYEPRPRFMLDGYNPDTYQFEIDLDTNNTLTGSLVESVYENYSFAIGETLENKIQQGEIIPVDGKFDSETEEVQLEIDKSITSGDYSLFLYKNSVQEQNENTILDSYSISIINE